MKRILSLMLCLFLILSFCACGDYKDNKEKEQSLDLSSESEAETTQVTTVTTTTPATTTTQQTTTTQKPVTTQKPAPVVKKGYEVINGVYYNYDAGISFAINSKWKVTDNQGFLAIYDPAQTDPDDGIGLVVLTPQMTGGKQKGFEELKLYAPSLITAYEFKSNAQFSPTTLGGKEAITYTETEDPKDCGTVYFVNTKVPIMLVISYTSGTKAEVYDKIVNSFKVIG